MTPLVYRIKDLEQSAQGRHLDADLDRAFLDSSLADAGVDVGRSKVHLEGQLLSQAPNVLLHGTLRGELGAECQRCLGPAVVPVDQRLRMIFAPPGDRARDEESADLSDPDDVDYAHHDRVVVDLHDMLREQLLLTLPITVLCKEDCKGLCPVCGADRNVTDCSCEASVSLSPFTVLKSLKH
jgi:uncharacterized protein